MQETKTLIQHIAPTLAAALDSPFKDVAIQFLIDNLINKDGVPENGNTIDVSKSLLGGA